MWLQFEDEQDCSQATSQKACDNEGEVGVFHRSGPQKHSNAQNHFWQGRRQVPSYNLNIGFVLASWYFAGMEFET